MATVILRTTAGATLDKKVREGLIAAQPYKHIVLLTGTPVTSIPAILALTSLDTAQEIHRFTRRSVEDSDFPRTEDGPTFSRFEPHLPESFVGHITAIAILMEDGTLWGYAPYLPEQGGLDKTTAFSWTLDLVIQESTTESPALNFTYMPLDYKAIRDKLLAEFGDTSTTGNTADMLPLVGGTMTGDIVFNKTMTGINWGMNTDGARIRFKNDSDADTDSYLEYQTFDNNNEYHKWTHNSTELMRLVPNDETNPLKVRNNKIVWHEGYLPQLIAALTNAGLGQSGSGSAGYLITAPIITGATATQTGQSVTLTAGGSQYLWGGSTGITYRWTRGDGTKVDAATINAIPGEAVSVIGRDVNGNMSISVSRTVDLATNAPPNVTNLTHNLPSRLTLGQTYNYILSGATDDHDSAATLTYNIDTAKCVGIASNTYSGNQRSLIVATDATSVSLVVYVADSQGAESVRKTFTWDSTQLDKPYLGSGVLTTGVHTVNVPAGDYTLIGRGGLGSSYMAGGGCSGTYCYDNGSGGTDCVSCLGGAGSDCGCDPEYEAYMAGDKTIVKKGATTVQSFNGSAATSAAYNTLAPLTTVVKTAATAITLTITVAASGGQCEVVWG